MSDKPKRWHCAGCNRFLPAAGITIARSIDDGESATFTDPADPEGLSHCPTCGEHEAYGSGWA